MRPALFTNHQVEEEIVPTHTITPFTAIEHCKRDIAALLKELKRLEDTAKLKPRHGDIVRYVTSYGNPSEFRIIIQPADKNECLVAYAPNGVKVCFSEDGATRCYNDGTYVVVGNVFDLAKDL
jgi:hypothetical protein